jgi:pectate lyase
MKRVFTKLACTAMATVMALSCAPVADFTTLTAFAVETEAAEAITAVAEGKNETVYAEWTPVEGATQYEAYVKKSSDSSYTQVDDELIRQYPGYWRVDVPGCAAGTYDLKIVAKTSSGDVTVEKKSISVNAYSRIGYAFDTKSKYGANGVGAYNNDGTLKSNAKVFYVTKDTAKTITADVVINSKGGTATYTGLQDIIYAKQKGYDTTPFDFRLVGTITLADMDRIDSSAEGLQVKGKNANAELNITIEGIGNDAAIKDFGILIRNAGNVELRNFAVYNCMDDSISIDTDNCNLWVHNLDLFYGQTGGDADQAKGDGTTDTKGGTTYVTISNNHYWDSGKSILCGMSGDSYTDYRITFANNWFDHSDSRHPRIRGGNVHVVNNYYDGNAKYGVGMTTGGSAFVENNYFRNVKYPMLISKQGTDALGTGTFSGEDGGYIKEYGNIMTGSYTFRSGEDAYSATSRDEQIPETYVAKVVNSGVYYSNFDTDSSMYSYTPLDAKDVPAYVVEYSGRINHGDLTWDFDNSTEDSNYSVITALKSAVTGYTTTLYSVGGTVTDEATGNAESATGVNGSKLSYDPLAKLEALSLPDETEESGNKASGSVAGASYDLKFETSNIGSGTTLSANKTITGTSGDFTVIATSDATVELNTAKGIMLGGSGSTTKRAVSFTTTSAGILYVTGTSTGSDTRTINVSDGTSVIGTISTGSSTSVVLPSAGTYYIYSSNKGINITDIGVIYDDGAGDDGDDGDDSGDTSEDVAVTVSPTDAGSYSFTTATKGTLTTDDSYGGAYASYDISSNNVTITANGALLTDTDTVNAAELTMPLGVTYTSGVLTISGTVTPSTNASKWAYIDIQGDNGSVLKIGTDGDKNNAIATLDANKSAVYTSSSTAATASKIAYTATIDLTNKTATVVIGNDTLTTDITNTSVDTLVATTSKTGTRNLTVGDITVSYSGDGATTTVRKGDANCDGSVDQKDAALVMKYIAGVATLTEKGYANAAAISGDTETVDILDAVAILKAVKTAASTTTTTTTTTKATTTTTTTEGTTETTTAAPAGTYNHNFTSDGTTSSIFTISGNLATNKGTATYNGLTLTQCLKMESSTSIKFSGAGNLTLVFGGDTAYSGKSVKVDGTKYTVPASGIVEVTLSSGSHEITKGDSINLYYMTFAAE